MVAWSRQLSGVIDEPGSGRPTENVPRLVLYQIIEAVGKLRAQERELAGLGFLARARRGKGLGEQVERQRGNVAAIDTALTGVDRESEALNKRRERERLQTLRTQRELGISRTPARQSELELELEL